MTKLNELPVGSKVIVRPTDVPFDILTIKAKTEPLHTLYENIEGKIVSLDDADLNPDKLTEVSLALASGYILVNINMPVGLATIMLDGRAEVNQ